MTKPKTALITGVTGQDGAYLAEFLLNKGYVVIAVQKFMTPGVTKSLTCSGAGRDAP